MLPLENKSVLLIISGGIAAYKALELIRLMRKEGASVRCILTHGGAQFITPLSVGSLSGQPVYTDLWSLKDETEMGHIRLSREADLVVVAPASANIIAKLAQGLADDLATTTLLATDKPVMIAPAMNPMMWENAATQKNIEILRERGIFHVGPCAGEMACGETGGGRLAEPEDILAAIQNFFSHGKRLSGLKALVTSGPTFEPVDPVRFIGNRSSGKQGHAIAAALRDMGADVTLVSGPVSLADPAGVKTVHVETGAQMLEACRRALPADIAVCAAAVSDWTVMRAASEKIKKQAGKNPPALELKENPDILREICISAQRPRLVIGFAAETENLLAAAREKRTRKQCDWIVANQVGGAREIFGADETHVYLVTQDEEIEWRGRKTDIAHKLCLKIAGFFERYDEHHLKAAE